MGSIRRARELADIAPQYVAKSGLCNPSELDSTKWGSIRIQHVIGLSNIPEGKSRFPKLDECAHFHYEHVEIGPLQVSIADDENLKPLINESEEEKWWSLNVESQGKTWLIRRSYDNFRMLDQQLHRCIYDRKFSELTELPAESIEDKENIHKLLSDYVKRFSVIAGNLINCGPILNWLELDNRGHRLLVPDNDNCPINTPAVAAAYSVKRYTAQAPDEISFEVGDMISVIDMPPPEESIWWHGKKGFQVGFFPCECVAVIGDKVPRNLQFSSLSSQPTKPVLRKHGKLIAFFRSFILSRPSRRRLKQSGILRERVFGCDLGEHLQNSGHEIPMVLKCCVEFIETHGLVDGIYRLSGVTSNIQKLRNAFDEDRVPALYEDEAILQDVHSVASLLKMYFRELPNPLCTYQLYHQFVGAVQATQGDDTRLLKMRDVVQKLPPPHYRTLEYLMRHLARVSEKGHETGMTSRNVAIVWAPNLLRCKELEVGGVAALQGVGVQAVVTEFLICYAELIFCDRLPNFSLPTQQVSTKKCRPKSLAISTPTKLLSLEEARNRTLLQASGKTDQGYIEVGGGPANLPAKYHTVIELPGYSRKRMGSKRSPLGWKSLFGKSGRSSQRKDAESKASTVVDIAVIPGKALTETDLAQSRRHLRPAKSAESLSSGLNSDMLDIGEPLSRVAGTIENTLSPVLLRTCEGKTNGHNRSVSHESYFDHLGEQKDNLDISEIEVNFELEESEMRIFSEDETIMSNGSGSLASNGSPRILPSQKLGKISSVKRLSYPKLTDIEDGYDNTQNADPSPKKQKTNDEDPPRSKLEEQLSSSAGDIQFIDSVSPDQGLGQGDVHPIQSPSPVSSISQISSSLLAPSSPILPHIPHLMKTFPGRVEPIKMRSSLQDDRTLTGKSVTLNDGFGITETKSSRPHSTVLAEFNSYSYLMNSTEQTSEATAISDKESLHSSELTTPETPICSTYTPLVDFEDSSSNLTTPDGDLDENIKKSPSENLNSNNSCLKANDCENIFEETAADQKKILSDDSELEIVQKERPHLEAITPNMVKLNELKLERIQPKPEERKPKPVHPYVNIPFVNPALEIRELLETSFDGEPITYNRNSDFSVKYEGMSTESSCDSLINVDRNEEDCLPLSEHSIDDSSLTLGMDFVISNKDDVSPKTPSPIHCKPEAESTEEESSTDNHMTNQNNQDRTFSPATETSKAESEKLNLLWVSEENHYEERFFRKGESSENLVEEKFEDEADMIGNPYDTQEINVNPQFISFGEDNLLEEKSEEIEDESITMEEESVIERNENVAETCTEEFFNAKVNPMSREIEGLLETDLDAPEVFKAVGNDADEIEVSPHVEEFAARKSSSNSNVRQLLSKFESSSTAEVEDSSGTVDFKPLQNKDHEANFSEVKATRQMGKFKSEDRPKTLERLSTRRKTETDSVEMSAEVQILEKSKSGGHINEKSPDVEKVDILAGCDFDLSDPQRRERIEKYKEKRRNYLREKYRSDSFKMEKDDFVLKIKQRHLRKSEWGEGRDREGVSVAECVPEPISEKRSPEKKERAPGPRLWKALDLTAKEPSRRSFSAEVTGRIRHDYPNVSVSLRSDSNLKSISNGEGERRSLSEVKSARSSPEKKNHFLSFSLGGSIKEDCQTRAPSSRKSSNRVTESPQSSTALATTTGVELTSSTAETKVIRQKTDDSKGEGSQASVLCIKDMAAIFEGRDDSKAAKQYLSSV